MWCAPFPGSGAGTAPQGGLLPSPLLCIIRPALSWVWSALRPSAPTPPERFHLHFSAFQHVNKEEPGTLSASVRGIPFMKTQHLATLAGLSWF